MPYESRQEECIVLSHISHLFFFGVFLQELPLAVLRRPDCFCGYASERFTLHEPAEESRCTAANGTGPASPADREFYQVYQTPVQGELGPKPWTTWLWFRR